MSVICAATQGHDGSWSTPKAMWMSVSYVITEGFANAHCSLNKSTWTFACLSVDIAAPRGAPSN